jgi:two-component system, LytTR family, response regulator
MKISCIIIEDEPLAAERTKSYVAQVDYLQLKGVFESGRSALDFLEKNDVDLLFLDINLGEMSGITLLEKNKINSHVIMTTAYQQYAVKGFDLNVTDYLLKPFVFERFQQAVEKVRLSIEKGDDNISTQFVLIKTEHRLEKVFLNEILYIEGMGDYRRVHTTSQRIMTLQTFREFEDIFPKDIIRRVHKSYMVNLNRITTYHNDSVQLGPQTIPVSQTYRPIR